MTRTTLHISINLIKLPLRVYCILFSHNSLIIHSMINQIVFGYFDVFILLCITIKSDMKTVKKIVTNLINENISSNVSSLRCDWRYLEIINLC